MSKDLQISLERKKELKENNGKKVNGLANRDRRS